MTHTVLYILYMPFLTLLVSFPSRLMKRNRSSTYTYKYCLYTTYHSRVALSLCQRTSDASEPDPCPPSHQRAREVVGGTTVGRTDGQSPCQ